MATTREMHTIPNVSSRIDTTLPVKSDDGVFDLMTTTPCEFDANLPVAVYVHTLGLSESSLGELLDVLNRVDEPTGFELMKLVPGQQTKSDGGDAESDLNFIDEPLMKSYTAHVTKFAVPRTTLWPRYYIAVDEADWRSKGVIVVALFEVLGYDEERPDADPFEVHRSERKNWSVDAVRFRDPKDAGLFLPALVIGETGWEDVKRQLRAKELDCDVQDL